MLADNRKVRMPRCPGEMFERLTREKWKCDEAKAKRALMSYRKLQRTVEKKFPDEVMPPCYDCRPLVFKYCRDTGCECRTFEMYTGGVRSDR